MAAKKTTGTATANELLKDNQRLQTEMEGIQRLRQQESEQHVLALRRLRLCKDFIIELAEAGNDAAQSIRCQVLLIGSEAEKVERRTFDLAFLKETEDLPAPVASPYFEVRRN